MLRIEVPDSRGSSTSENHDTLCGGQGCLELRQAPLIGRCCYGE